MTNKTDGLKIILFTCNWHAFSSLEFAGHNKHSYSPEIFPIRLSCLGRITPGIILKAFEKGADGVYLLGCPESECQYHTGSAQTKEVVKETKELIKLLGYHKNQLQLEFIHTEDNNKFAENIQDFLNDISQIKVVL